MCENARTPVLYNFVNGSGREKNNRRQCVFVLTGWYGRDIRGHRKGEFEMALEFFISRNGNLTSEGELIGNFGTEAAAADMAIRFAQDSDRLYRIFYA